MRLTRDKPRSKRWKKPPSWILPGSDEPIPQPLLEAHAKRADLGVALPQILDTPWWLDWVKAKQLGYGGVNRYWCHDWNTGPSSSFPNKRVNYTELQQIVDAGLDFLWNAEDAAGDYNKGYAYWLQTGQLMADYGANVLKLPNGVGGYGSMDMDPGLIPKQVHFESQRGFHDGYKLGPAGVYGGIPAINAFADAGTSSLGWITIAKSWSHGVLTDPGVGHLEQVGSAFSGSADTNNVLIVPHGSLLQVQGGGMSQTDIFAINTHTDARLTVIGDMINALSAKVSAVQSMASHERQLVKTADSPAIYYGDRVTRRWINDQAELADLKASLATRGFDSAVYTLGPTQQLDEWGLLIGPDYVPPPVTP